MPLPMISIRALGTMPEFVLANMGGRVLDKALDSAGLTHAVIDKKSGFIPKASFTKFFSEVDRAAGVQNIGLMWAPALTVRDYGNWGRYVLGASTLGEALTRAQSVMPLHSSSDVTEMRLRRNHASYEYKFSLKGHSSYPDIGFSAVGSVLSIFHNFLGNDWRPLHVNCDFPKVRHSDDAEMTFGCPVNWDTDRLEICFPVRDLLVSSVASGQDRITLEDLKRERTEEYPRTYVDLVVSILQRQTEIREISLDRIANALNLGPRSLQRRLRSEGDDFRSIANRVVIGRAKELLHEGDLSVKGIAIELGYDNPQNFSRAFKNGTGVSPSEFTPRCKAHSA